MFMLFMWFIVDVAGGVWQANMVSFVATVLTEDIDEDDATIPVSNTNGFPDSGFITIDDERIGYADKTATTFVGSVAQPLLRGAQGTTADNHVEDARVRTIESSILNQSMGYKLAVLTDSSGLIAFVAIPFAFISLLATFFILPLTFLGTDLQILTYFWAILSIGLIVAMGIALAGGRRV